MEVTFVRTGARRYAVEIALSKEARRRTEPAPGYDDHIPHDLVHYLVEATLRLRGGVFGRAERGGSSFFLVGDGLDARQRSREQRRQQKREAKLDRSDKEASGDMDRAERLALLCDVTWRRRHGQRGDQAPWLAPVPATDEESMVVERVLAALEPVAAQWHALPIGGALTFEWPSLTPRSSDSADGQGDG